MKQWKKMLAFVLATVLVGTALPTAAFAQGAKDSATAAEAGETGEQGTGVSVTPQEGRERTRAARKAVTRSVAENYTTLTVGQELHKTDGEQERYLFAPEESGYYLLSAESVNGQDFYLEEEKCFCYTDKDGNKVQEECTFYNYVRGQKEERILWLNQEEEYLFRYGAEQNYSTDEYDFTLQIDKVDIKDITVAKNPTADSYNFLNYSGMQVSINFADGSSLICDTTGDRYNCYIKAFEWEETAYSQQRRIHPYGYLQSVDGQENQNIDIASLAVGDHTAVLEFREYDNEGNMLQSYSAQLGFAVKRNNVASLQVRNAKTEYTQDFNEYLGDFELQVSYNDGTADKTLQSQDNEVEQYLTYSVEGENGAEEQTTTSIDTYLKNGGNTGKAAVTVAYRGSRITYDIDIQENPYERMEVIPERSVYYKDCICRLGDNVVREGDYIKENSNIVLHRKDGAQEAYNRWYDLPQYWDRGNYGLKLGENGYYQNIDAFLSAGGTAGAQQAEGTYCGITASYPVTIEENPYDHISIAQAPAKLTYLHNKYQELDLSGLVIYAYKDAEETEYDTYSYDDYQNYKKESGGMTEEQYYIMRDLFCRTLGGHDSIEYLELGEHTVSVFLMGHKAEYTIKVIDKMAERMTILQAPRKLSYYANSRAFIDLSGLIIEVEDLQGNVTKYAYANNHEEDGSYGDWYEIEKEFFSITNNIDWGTPGNYTVTLSVLGIEEDYEVTLLPDPVKQLTITKAPDKMSYYQFEYYDIDLTGMEYEVAFRDGSSFSGKAQGSGSYFDYKGESFPMVCRWKATFNGEVQLGDNMIVVSAFGASSNITGVTVKENPVKSLQVVKNPEKMQYIGGDNRIDLYGMELLVTYVDGGSEKVVVAEHTSQKEMDNQYGGAVTVCRGSDWIDGEERFTLEVSYLNERVRILLPEVDLSALGPVGLEDEGSYHTVLTEENPYMVYSFTPAETKEYHFFSTGTFDNYVVLYEGNREIADNDDGAENNNFCLSYTLEAGRTYYYVASNYHFGSAAEFDCYFSSCVKSLSELEESGFEVSKGARTEYYDFESDRIYAGNLSLSGTEYRIIYSNGWARTGVIDNDYGSSTTIGGKTLSVEWKYTVWDEYEWNRYVEKRDDNALVYTYGDEVIEFPVKFDVPSPVESLEVMEDSWKDKSIYEYQANNFNSIKLSVKIHYNDGREDEVAEAVGGWGSHNGYSVSMSWKEGELKPGQENILLLSYMGKTAEIPVMVLENPVASIQVLQLPEKTEYYPFEYDITNGFDLYGIKIQINYKDGTKQIAEGTSHSNKIEVPGTYQETLSAYLDYIYDEMEEREACCISYMGYKVEFMPYKIRKFTPEDSISLSLDKEEQADLQGRYQIFSFVAPETGNYRFRYTCGDGTDSDYNRLALYSPSGDCISGSSWSSSLEYEMTGGKRYYVAVIFDISGAGKITCSITRQPDRERENIQTVDLPLNSLNAGEWLPDYNDSDCGECYISASQWLNDAEDDERADYGTAHTLKLVLKPYSNYKFTSSTSVLVNGKRIVSKSLADDGSLTLYYTFPYTDCSVTVPNMEGYELDESQNAQVGVCSYGEDYRFRYTKEPGSGDSSKLIVRAGVTVLTPDADGYYTVEKVMGNVTVTAKANNLQAGAGESGLTFYNKSADIYDIMVGRQNGKIADNENSENSLPVLKSYADGSDQFFFGWYLDKDASANGKGTRFTSQSILIDPSYSLYAKWGSGYFSYIMNNKQINCKILSIDEYNKTKVQVGDGSNKSARAVRKSGGVMALAQSVRSAASGDALVIPEALDLKNNENLAGLGVDFAVGEVTAIADNAFAGETGITRISLPKTVEHIGSGAFAGCIDLQSIEIPEGVSRIGESAFSGCESLQSVSVPSTVGVISEGMFQGCANLARVSIAEGVSKIEAGAFDGCGSLTTVMLPDTIESVDATSFAANKDLTIICSNEMKNSDVIQAVQEATGAKVMAVDVNLNCDYNEKQFVYGDREQTFSASVSVDGSPAEDREVLWTYPDTDAYRFAVSQDKKSLTVTPGRVTAEDENIVITASDTETGKSRSVTLKTTGIDLGGMDGDGESIYSIREIARQEYTGQEICPQVEVVNNILQETLGAENYDVSYNDNIHVGTATVTVQGKGNYRGTITANFRIEGEEGGAEKKQQIISVASKEIHKNVGDGPFELQASTSGDGTLSYQSSDTRVATVGNTAGDRGMVTIVGAGTAEITVTASETGQYYEASAVIVLTVEDNTGGTTEKKPQIISVASDEILKNVGDGPFELQVSTSGDGTLIYQSSDTRVATVGNTAGDRGMVTIVGAGTAEITVTASETERYYEASTVIRLTVESNKGDTTDKKDAVITASDITKTYGDADFAVSASVTGDGVLSYEGSDGKVISVDSKTGKVKIVGAGTAQITVRSSATKTYNEAVKTIRVVVKQADAKLRASKQSYSKTYGAKAFMLGVSANATLSYNSSDSKVAEFKDGKIYIKSCGTATVTVSVADSNYAADSRKITIKVLPKKASAKKAVSKKAGTVTVTWKKQKEASGYVVQYSTDKKFKKKVKSVTVKKNGTTKTTIKKLKKGKKYYVRVMAYTKAGSKKQCGAASKRLEVKVKK